MLLLLSSSLSLELETPNDRFQVILGAVVLVLVSATYGLSRDFSQI